MKTKRDGKGACATDLTPAPIMVVGFLSLHRLQGLVTRHFGIWIGWGVVAICSFLGSAGVAMGRFLRWNSWDALLQPVRLVQGSVRWLKTLGREPGTVLFLALFALFLFRGYLMFHSMSRAVREGDPRPNPNE